MNARVCLMGYVQLLRMDESAFLCVHICVNYVCLFMRKCKHVLCKNLCATQKERSVNKSELKFLLCTVFLACNLFFISGFLNCSAWQLLTHIHKPYDTRHYIYMLKKTFIWTRVGKIYQHILPLNTTVSPMTHAQHQCAGWFITEHNCHPLQQWLLFLVPESPSFWISVANEL